MTETTKKALMENIEARKNKLETLDNIVENYEETKQAFADAEVKFLELGDIEVAKAQLLHEISEIENDLFPKTYDDNDTVAEEEFLNDSE